MMQIAIGKGSWTLSVDLFEHSSLNIQTTWTLETTGESLISALVMLIITLSLNH